MIGSNVISIAITGFLVYLLTKYSAMAAWIFVGLANLCLLVTLIRRR